MTRPVLVSLHAHPDDEALLTGGTLAAAAADGWRTVLVVATDGAAGLADPDWRDGLGARRMAELERSAEALGVARLVPLGYADSGWHGTRPSRCFASTDVTAVARRVAQVLDEEDADVLTSYDRHGGYGHPDHVQVHRVGRAATALAARRPRLLEATVDRDLLLPVGRVLRTAARLLPVPEVPDLHETFTARREVTHRVDVRDQVPAKCAALRAHASQQTGGPRTVSLLLGLPGPLRRRVLGTEWFHAPGPAAAL